MKTEHTFLLLPLSIICVEPTELVFKHSHDEVSISISDYLSANRSTPALPTIAETAEYVTINIPTEAINDAVQEHAAPNMASPEWEHMNCSQRVRQVCVNNKTAVVAGIATVSSAAVAGIVTLIVHFTTS